MLSISSGVFSRKKKKKEEKGERGGKDRKFRTLGVKTQESMKNDRFLACPLQKSPLSGPFSLVGHYIHSQIILMYSTQCPFKQSFLYQTHKLPFQILIHPPEPILFTSKEYPFSPSQSEYTKKKYMRIILHEWIKKNNFPIAVLKFNSFMHWFARE